MSSNESTKRLRGYIEMATRRLRARVGSSLLETWAGWRGKYCQDSNDTVATNQEHRHVKQRAKGYPLQQHGQEW
jgi:hypothetical protein